MTDSTPDALSVSESGPVAVGGNVTITGAVAAGRDVVIERLSVIADDGAPFGDAASRPGAEGDVCPYPGIQPFGEAQRPWFVGRERDRRAVLDRLDRSDFVAVIGGSGSGKSSLLAAGVAPDFVDTRRALGETWEVRTLRPGAQPGTTLRRYLHQTPSAPTLWVVDQLEEAFARAVDDGERADFLDAVCDIAAGRHGVAKVLVALRSDFYPALDVHRGIADAVAADQHRLLPLDADALRDVIVLPAERVGLRVEPALVAQVLDDVDPGTNQLPLVAFAMRETWRRRRNGWLTLAGYVDSGGVREALENGARAVWSGLSSEQRATAKRVLLRLTSSGEGRAATRQRVIVDGLVTDRDDLDAVVDVLERFTRERLVVPDQDDAGRPTVDIAHEALLREWSVMRGWLGDDLDARRLQRDLSDAARAWDEAGREPTGLFAGRRLQAVRDGRRNGEITVNETEAAFVDAAERREHRDRRRTVLLTVLPLVLALALAIVGLVVIQQRRTAEQKTIADSLQLAAEARTLTSNRRDAAALLAVAALRTDESDTTLGTLIDTVADPDGPLAYSLLAGGQPTVLATRFNVDHDAVVGMSDGSLRVVDPTTGRETAHIDVDLTAVTAVDVAADGTVVAGGSGGRVAVISAGGTQPIIIDGPSGAIASVGYDPQSRVLVVATATGTLSRWRVSGEAIEPLGESELGAGIYAVELVTTADAGPSAVVATTAGSLVTVDALTGEVLSTIENAFAGGERVSLDSAAQLLVVQDPKRVRAWDLAVGRPTVSSDDFSGATSLAIAPSTDQEAGLAFTGTTSGDVQTWTLDPRPIPIGPPRAGLNGTVVSVATDGQTVVGLDESGQLIAWDVAGRRAPAGRTWSTQESTAGALALSPTGDLATGDGGGFVTITDAAGISHLAAWAHAAITGVAWSSPTRLVVGSADGVVRTIDPTTAPTIDGPGDIYALEFEPVVPDLAPAGPSPIVDVTHRSGTTAFATADGAVTVIVGDQPARSLVSPSVPVEALALSDDGAMVAIGTGMPDNSVVLWDLTTENDEPAAVLDGHDRQVTSVAFSPSGDLLASGSDDHTIRLWSVPSGDEVAELEGHTDLVDALAFSPDGRLLASGGEDYTLRVWDVARHVQLGQPWRFRDATIEDFEVAADGRTLFAANGIVVRWVFGVEAWRDAACALAGRELSPAEWAELAPNHRPTTVCAGGSDE